MNPSDVDTVAVSYADEPVDSDPDHAAALAASNTPVAVDEEPPPTENGSHALVDPVKFESPDVNVAWKLYAPAANGPTVLEFGGTPATSGPPPAAVPDPEHDPFPNHV